jgi:hypothetical protein
MKYWMWMLPLILLTTLRPGTPVTHQLERVERTGRAASVTYVCHSDTQISGRIKWSVTR